jgi:hypothetical protein
MTTEQIELLEALRDCCYYKAPAVILSPELGIVCHARFAGFTAGTVDLELTGAEKPPPRDSACCVSFIHAPNRRAFFARVLEYQHKAPPELPVLSLEMPSETVGIDARMAYRVPIVKTQDLKARVFAKNGRVLFPKLIDLSLTGSLMEFAPAEDPGFPVGSAFKLQLITMSEIADLKAEVRRRREHSYGVFFPEVVGDQGITPPQALRNIIEHLERNWLRERVR